MAPKQRSLVPRCIVPKSPSGAVVENFSEYRGPNACSALPDRIRAILRARNLTLYKVAALTRAHYAHESRYHIPRNFYFKLRSAGWTPTLHQLFALSRVSHYRLADWLVVFGLHLQVIPCLQGALPYPRTMLLDSSLCDEGARIPWFRDRFPRRTPPAVAPLSQLLESFGELRPPPQISRAPGPYLYAKIGRHDAFAFPNLLPGSIVRFDSQLVSRLVPKPGGEISKNFFLIEHSRGVSCCRLYFGTNNRVTLTSTQLPFANIELQLGSEARVLGVADLELRPSGNHRRMAHAHCSPAEVAPDLTRLWTPALLKKKSGFEDPTLLVHSARLRAGLSLRRASEMSRGIATNLHDKRYLVSPGWLSDFEASGVPPRHLQKLFTICMLYSLRFEGLLKSLGFAIGDAGEATIPDEWMLARGQNVAEYQRASSRDHASPSGFLSSLLEQLGEVPFFLWHSLVSSSGLPELTLRDVFWVGGQPNALHPSLAGALFVIVNRRKRKPRILSQKSPWEQPVYLLMRRDGSYLLASCSLEDSTFVVHPYTENFTRPERLRDGVDAQLVGQVVTIVRSLLSPP